MVHGYGAGGNANHQGQGYDRAVRHVCEAVLQAFRTANLDISMADSAQFALAGDDVPDDHEQLGSRLTAAFPGLRFKLGNDVWAGLRAGAPENFGVAVNCGSGCGAVGRAADGRDTMIPDLGYEFGDSGGGGQIASDTLRAVVRAWDGRGPSTSLTTSVLRALDYADVDTLYLALHKGAVRRPERAILTGLVFGLAVEGDAVAISILERIGDELGLAGATIALRLGLSGASFPFVLTGGAFRTLESPLAQAAIARMQATAPGARPTLPLVTPVAGAALLALDNGELRVGLEHYAALRAQGYAWHPEETRCA